MPRVFYPYRPNLQGGFLARFHSLAQELCATEDPVSTIDELAFREYEWATRERVNPSQRQIYRAVWLFFRDLLRSGWSCRWYESTLQVSPPDFSLRVTDEEAKQQSKGLVRTAMRNARLQRLSDSVEFIRRMENPGMGSRNRVSILELVADGQSLYEDMAKIAEIADAAQKEAALRCVIKPYLQLVREDAVCSETGLRLADIWRYFRLTWSSPFDPTPGRTLLYLVRDAARRYHPVIGIASLENAAIHITSRDDFLGWSLQAFQKELEASSQPEVLFARLMRYIDASIEDIDLTGLCTRGELENPSPSLLQRLAAIAQKASEDRKAALRAWLVDSSDASEESVAQRSELGSIPVDAETALFLRKRADQLGRLIASRAVLTETIASISGGVPCQEELQREDVQRAIRVALQAQKSRHVGTSILELNVCGAIPPYNEILGGKLVALMMLSPQVLRDYRERYGNSPSQIASRLKGASVVRPADLIYIGTTSLYGVGSSQYNRLRLPPGLARSGSPAIEWQRIGSTTGYGTLHISRLTVQCLEEVAIRDGITEVNHVFGEGPSPKMRIVRAGLEKIFEPGQPTEELGRHAMERIVYGVWLASNGREYLMGNAEHPEYFFDMETDPITHSDRIAEFWLKRWVARRLNYRPALDRLREFDKKSLLLSQQIEPVTSPKYQPIQSEKQEVNSVTDTPRSLRDFVQNLYRGPAAYADKQDLAWLEEIHVETALDGEIERAVAEGKTVILTGNPGDGKTHLLRVLESRLSLLPKPPVVVLDASSIRDEELMKRWMEALNDHRPFCAAINEAVLFGLADTYRSFKPLQEAIEQVSGAIVYEAKSEANYETVVYDLSHRNVLSESIVRAVLDKMTDPNLLKCDCPGRERCDFQINRVLLRDATVRKRLQQLLDRVSRRGYHATLRELQAFVAYLLYGGRDCDQLLQTSGGMEHSFPQLPLIGVGRLFDQIRCSFDPGRTTHPVVDDLLVSGRVEADTWVDGWAAEVDALDPYNASRIVARKRAYFFCNKDGHKLLDLANDDETLFGEFLTSDNDKDTARTIIRKINAFFGAGTSAEDLRVWQSHRFGQSSRRILYSVTTLNRRAFEVARPRLRHSMAKAFDLAQDHLMFRLRNKRMARLRVDFPMFQLLAQAERGVPVLFLDNDASRRLWTFMEMLSEPIVWEDDVTVTVMDPFSKQQLTVTVDGEARKYLEIRSTY